MGYSVPGRGAEESRHVSVSRDFLRIFVWKPVRLAGCVLGAGLLAIVLLSAGERRIRVQGGAEVPPGQPTLEELHASMRPMTRSAAARTLEVLGAALGLDLAPKGKPGTRPSVEKRERFRLLKKDSLANWIGELEARPDDAEVAAPVPVQAFLAEHDEALGRFVAHLREHGEALEWEMDPADLPDSPLPNLVGILDAVRLLEAATLEADRSGDASKARQSLEASFLLAESLERRPELISFLISLAIDGMHHVQVRRFRNPQEEWGARLGRRDLLVALRQAHRTEALLIRDMSSSSRSDYGWLKPYVEFSLADTARRMDRVAFAHDRLTWESVQGNEESLWKNPCPRWNIVCRVGWPDFGSLPYRVVRRKLDREVTNLILRAKVRDLGSCAVDSRAAPGKALHLERLDGDHFEVEALVGLEEPHPDTICKLPLRFLGTRP